MARGPKPRTLKNSRKGIAGSLVHTDLTAPSDLTPAALAEYQRLLGVLQSGGTLERVDLAVVAEAGRVKDLLDRAYAEANALPQVNSKLNNIITSLTSQRRGLLRELGLTSLPSRTIFRAKPQGSERDETQNEWAGKLKIS